MQITIRVEFHTGVSHWIQTGITLVSHWYQTVQRAQSTRPDRDNVPCDRARQGQTKRDQRAPAKARTDQPGQPFQVHCSQQVTFVHLHVLLHVLERKNRRATTDSDFQADARHSASMERRKTLNGRMPTLRGSVHDLIEDDMTWMKLT